MRTVAPCRRMSQAEVEVIHEHWPLLREITVMGSQGLELRTKTHLVLAMAFQEATSTAFHCSRR